MSTPSLNAVVTQKVDVSPELIILRVAPRGWTLKEFIPGQFTILGLPGSAPRIPWADAEEKKADPEKLIKRPYSVASSSLAREYIEFYIALVRSGMMTPRLFNLKVGNPLWLSEDFRGIFTLTDVPKEAHIIMIATENFTDEYNRLVVQDSHKNPNYAYSSSSSSTSGATKSSRDDVLDQIEKLAKLRDSGAITQEEYEAKKAILMAKI